MDRSKFYLVSDDYLVIQKVKSFCESQGLELEVYSEQDWRARQSEEAVSVLPLAQGNMPMSQGNVIPFPTQKKSVQTINELESDAIEKAIFEFNGNLTEAAKALGIGRATLYRKVKQYNIDPNIARRRKVA